MVKFRNHNDGISASDQGERFASLDATRGVLLLLMVGGGFGIREMLTDERWQWIARHAASTEWAGCTLWDLPCPAFRFVAGVAMPYSYANRQARGQNWARQFLHALLRAAVLVAIGMYLDSYLAKPPRLTFDLRGDLQQIGLAYLLAFLVLPLGMPVQGVTVAFLLIGHTATHVIYAFASGQELWSPTHAHVGVAIDSWIRLGAHPEKYVAFNALGAAAIVLTGVLVGGLVRSGLTAGVKIAIMTGCSVVAILLGWALSGGGGIGAEWPAVIPMIRRLMTLTFIFTAVGWTLLAFTYLYLVIDGIFLRAWAVPLSLVGRNSLLLYLTYQLFHGWAETSARLVLPSSPPLLLTLQPLFAALIVLAIYWLFAFWLYRRRIFFTV